MKMNLNEFFNKLVNFKIKHKENPSPTQVSNADLYFLLGASVLEFDTVVYDEQAESVVIEFKRKIR